MVLSETATRYSDHALADKDDELASALTHRWVARAGIVTATGARAHPPTAGMPGTQQRQSRQIRPFSILVFTLAALAYTVSVGLRPLHLLPVSGRLADCNEAS